MYWSWDVDGMFVPDSTLLWNLPKGHCPASDMSALGNEPSWILAPLKGLGSHLFFHPDQHSQGQGETAVLGSVPHGHFRDPLSLPGPSHLKREVATDMKDEWNLAPWHQGRGLQPVLPYSACSQTSFSQVQSHRSGLESGLAQMSTERKSLDAQTYRTGNGIWTQLGKYSQVPEKLGFCTLSEVTEIQLFILLLWKEKAPQGGNWSH